MAKVIRTLILGANLRYSKAWKLNLGEKNKTFWQNIKVNWNIFYTLTMTKYK